MAGSLATRLPKWLDSALRRAFRERREGPSEGLRRIAEEWWAMNQFPAIEFRDGPGHRRAAVRGGPDVWEIVQVWKDEQDRDAVAAHFDWVERDRLDQALRYYQKFPDAVDGFLAENERLAKYAEPRRR